MDVVVVTYNSERVIEGLLDSVPAALGEVPGKVAVVDNGSRDRTREIVGNREGMVLVEAPNRGYAAGLNRGITELSGSGPILAVNPDVRLAPGGVAALLAELGRPGVGVVVPKLSDPDGSIARSLRREPTVARSLGAGDSMSPRLSEIVNEPEAYAAAHDVEWATGAVMLVDRECYDALGGFDESFFMYSEETDFCLRARDRGFATRYTPAAEAMHIGGESGRNPELYAMQVLNRVRLHRRRHGLMSSAAFAGLALARESVHATRGNPDSRRAAAALVRRSRRPAQLPWKHRLLTRTTAP